MIEEIFKEVECAIATAYEQMRIQDYVSFILFIGRADTVSKNPHQKRCVIDYELDRYYDRTREGFYIRYLNRNYCKEGFHYEGDMGIDDLSIEMMIYTHLWDSSYFLKSLVRVASILSGKGYEWSHEIEERGKWDYIHDNIINPLKEYGFSLGKIVEKAYSSDIRDSFAHSLYIVNEENRTITLRPKRGTTKISFDEFQQKFLYSVILMNLMHNALESNHDKACCMNALLTDPFYTPDGIKIQIKAEHTQQGTINHFAFRMIPIKDD